MEVMNIAFADVDAFKKMMDKVTEEADFAKREEILMSVITSSKENYIGMNRAARRAEAKAQRRNKVKP